MTEQDQQVNARNPLWRDVRLFRDSEPRETRKVQLALRPLSINADKKIGFTLRAVELVP